VGDLQDDCVNFGMLRASKRCLIIILRRKSSNRKLGFRYKVNENTFRLRSSRSVRETQKQKQNKVAPAFVYYEHYFIGLFHLSEYRATPTQPLKSIF